MDADKTREYNRAYRASHKSEYRAYRRKSYAKNKEKISAYRKAHQDEHKVYAHEYYVAHYKRVGRATHLMQRYGISEDDYREILRAQGSVCKICGALECGAGAKHFRVDHDHRRGKVRGLLCHNCNAMLGHARDDRSILESAVLYLRGVT